MPLSEYLYNKHQIMANITTNNNLSISNDKNNRRTGGEHITPKVVDPILSESPETDRRNSLRVASKYNSNFSDDMILGAAPTGATEVSREDYRNYLRTGELTIIPEGVGSLGTPLTYDENMFLNGDGTYSYPSGSGLVAVVNLGSGTTIGDTSGLNITLKSISARGGISILGNANNIILSGGSSSSSSSWTTLTNKPQWLSGTTLQAFQLGHTHSQYSLNTTLTGLTQTVRNHTGNTSIHFKQSGITITESQVTNLTHDLADRSLTGHTHSYTGGTILDLPILFTGNTFIQSGITVISKNGDAITIFVPSDSITGVTWSMVSGKPQWLSGQTLQAFETGHTHNVVNVNNISSAYTTTISDNFVGVSVSSLINLYGTPIRGQKVTVADVGSCASINPITICSTLGINGGSLAVINTDYGSITFIYNGGFWSAVSFTG